MGINLSEAFFISKTDAGYSYEKNDMVRIKSREMHAQLGAPGREGASKQASACESDISCDHKTARAKTLSRIMESEQEARTQEVLLSKRHRARFRKNRLWNKKERNGKVICIKPESCLNRG